MLKQSLLALAIAGALTAHAQAPAPTAPATAAPAVPSSPAKKELIARILKHQQPAIEGIARSLVEQPAMDLMQDVSRALPARVPKDKQDAVAKDIQADVKKYLDATVPLVQSQAVKLAPATVGAAMDEKFTEDELRQLAGIIESPVFAKYQRLGDEMHKALADRLVAETRSTVEPRVRAMEESVAKRLGISGAPAAGAAPQGGAARPPAKK